MKNIISTWICLDNEQNGTWFPSAKGNSSSQKVHNIYWRCVSCFFATARHHNPGADLVFFSNTATLPITEGVNIAGVFERLGVRHYVTPFEFQTPNGYWHQWRNQFYEFSILKFISSHPDFHADDRFLLLDSDCIITKDLSSLFEDVAEHGCISYTIDYDITKPVHGNSRMDMQKIYSGLLGRQIDSYPEYHAGEFYASTVAVAKIISEDFYPLWKELNRRFVNGERKFNEEAQTLGFLYYKNNYLVTMGGKYIKRMWTDPATYRNIEYADRELAIWHLPSEKRTGFMKYFYFLRNLDFDLSSIDEEWNREKIETIFMVPSIPLVRLPYFFGKKVIKNILVK